MGRCGKAEVWPWGRDGAPVPRRAGPDSHRKEARAGTVVLGEGGPRRLFCFGHRPLVTWPGCHFVARPPFRAAEWGQGGGGGAAVASRGRGWRQRSGFPPPEAQASSVPFVLRLRARRLGLQFHCGPPRRLAGYAGRVKPRKAAERRAQSSRSFLPTKPLESGLSPPHPCYVKGIHFTRQCSEVNRGKLEFHPEKEGASWSPVLVAVVNPFTSPSLNHNGAVYRSYTAQLRQWRPNKGAKHRRN
ncbi:hypothetical protein mRhiFer1_010225 [Rhinolophus ferrumequinum]|uniref:Uncharacterized protein n=1 Tax=Rhinolophus ferrumequinum TaxID=59479 RepID=A0A7J7X574_RHIFE|nr:hypothetical protein mRhiFer1_010225 [Rhinolophus ferrumequinum]